jgi:hypothetical protein
MFQIRKKQYDHAKYINVYRLFLLLSNEYQHTHTSKLHEYSLKKNNKYHNHRLKDKECVIRSFSCVVVFIKDDKLNER